MKKELYLKFLFLLAVMLIGNFPVFAHDFIVDNIYYTYNADGISVSVSGASLSYNYGDVVIPETVTNNGVVYSVTAIGNRAFFQYYNLNSIEIPNTVTFIGDYAFGYCRGLNSIEIPNSVTSIGESAFAFCSNLITATVSKSVTSLSRSLFDSCSNLTYVTFGDSITSIGAMAFDFCSIEKH